MSVFNLTGAASRLGLAVALAAGTATVFAGPAYAQKKDAKAQAAPKANYSKGFVGVYQPFAKKLDAGGDLNPLKAELPAIAAAAQTADDKFAIGQVTYSIGAKTSDPALQRQGLAMMIDSGSAQIGSDRGKLAYATAQLAYQAKDWATVQARAQQAIDANYGDDAAILLSESYFAQDQIPGGLAVLDKAIAAKVAAGQPVPEAWLKRAVSVAYQAKLDGEATKFANLFAQYYPSATSWGDAIAIQRNLNDYEPQALLDLMRLANRANALRSERDYVDYIGAVDARRFPGETQKIIAQGIAAGHLKANDVFVAEANSVSSSRLKADQADLPGLARDARLPGATLATLMAAGDAFLSYGQAAEAEEFYTRALTKPGADTARMLTRLGIAQLDQGKRDAAIATFAKVDGVRKPIAALWTIYARQGAPAAQ
ncbi:hypothetical protein GRI40_02410 [Altererythrobacter aerius]|uniref:Uncharacterized protein n=1 Tax=Tsuneonella aeria TaxID=1837929 RepID=A0A6I4TAE3_9SPHN|nr:hypothetical protein [Tsuneonella aeria]MXO74073.1 hypothetical protein [Tsuneonella aeria]